MQSYIVESCSMAHGNSPNECIRHCSMGQVWRPNFGAVPRSNIFQRPNFEVLDAKRLDSKRCQMAFGSHKELVEQSVELPDSSGDLLSESIEILNEKILNSQCQVGIAKHEETFPRRISQSVAEFPS